MKKGEKRTVIVPWWLGYGANGIPPKIPARASLVFEIELLDFQ
jgi:FKBP-type peptidyl-prolyl cis-trans isomerase